MLVIHYHTAFKALDSYVQKHNQKHQEQRSKQVRQSVTATAKELVRIYGASLAKANTIEKLDIEKLPSLRTNNVQLAKLSHSSTRTIQRHISKLLDTGIVTKKLWHGSNSSYELWINPKILLVKGQITPKSAKEMVNQAIYNYSQSANKQYVKNKHTPNCPHTDSHNSIDNNIIIEVDKSGKSSVKSRSGKEMGLSGNTSLKELSGNTQGNGFQKSEDSSSGEQHQCISSGNTSLRGLSGNTQGNEPKKNNDAQGNGRDLQNLSGNKKKSDDARSAILSNRVDMLWMLAKKVLYKDVFLNEYQEHSAKTLLRKWYEPVEGQYLSKVHQIYVDRISLVRKYVSKDPEKRYVQLPDRYFDLNNPSGFRGTKAWWEADQKRKEQVKIKLILKAQIRRFLNNQRKTDETRKPALALFRDCEQRLGKLKNPQLLQMFHKAVLHTTTQSLIN